MSPLTHRNFLAQHKTHAQPEGKKATTINPSTAHPLNRNRAKFCTITQIKDRAPKAPNILQKVPPLGVLPLLKGTKPMTPPYQRLGGLASTWNPWWMEKVGLEIWRCSANSKVSQRGARCQMYFLVFIIVLIISPNHWIKSWNMCSSKARYAKAFPPTQCSLKARKHKNRKPIVHGIPILYCNETEAQFLHLKPPNRGRGQVDGGQLWKSWQSYNMHHVIKIASGWRSRNCYE